MSRAPADCRHARWQDDSAGNRQRRFQWRVTERQHTDGEHYKPSRAKHYMGRKRHVVSCRREEPSCSSARQSPASPVKGPADWNDAAKRGKGGKEEGQRETVNEAQQQAPNAVCSISPDASFSTSLPQTSPLWDWGRPPHPRLPVTFEMASRWGEACCRHLCQRPNLSGDPDVATGKRREVLEELECRRATTSKILLALNRAMSCCCWQRV
ncbi:unnamed protein product [Acanthosepion pharaonis]|uniref:Uncharacterized protein n=1 Tax=Acanthosepion pharaonis TaxID=158019 RepID=A0A812DV03_ACAPH|nr:unnamed protein product [Sepia pharaonis]